MKGAEKVITHFLLKERSKQARDNRYIRGSSIGMCKRKIGYQLLGYQPVPENGHSMFILNLGNAIHDMLQKTLVDMEWIKAKMVLKNGGIDWEQTDDEKSGCELLIFDHEKRVIGHCDGVTVPLAKRKGGEGLDGYYPDPSGERYLIEIKSISDKPNFWVLGIRNGEEGPINEEDCPPEFIDLSYEESGSKNKMQKLSRYQHSRTVRSKYGSRICPVYKVKVGNKDELVTVLMAGNSMGAFSSLEKPKSEHVMQASLYANYLGIEKILFLYVGKDIDSRSYDNDDLLNFPIKIFEHEVDDLDIGVIEDKIETIYSFVDKKELPPRDYNWEDNKSPCKFCDFNWQCWKDKVNTEVLDARLETLGIPKLKEGPEVMHKAKKDLKATYKNKKVQ